MKFRLSPGTFSELDLAKEDMDNMENVAAMIVDSAIEDFELLRLDKNGFADKRWKPIKRKAGVVLYEDRSMRENIKRESTLSEMPQPCGIHPLMAHGTTRVERTDALDVAIDEIRRASPLLAAESGLAVTSASSLFSLINSDQFDRDCFFHTY
ncbi:hypothetical protein PC112_g2726 [Phytophthora cactorum]|nr:hypothetical protein PC112_g2726 [Phytophthora cactorum]